MNETEPFYRYHMPHYQSERETYHVVFRLAASLPASVVEEMRFQRELEKKRILKVENERDRSILLRESRWNYFDPFEKLLAGTSRGPFWLRKSEIAEIVDEAIHYRDKKEYDLIAHSIMPNHIHGIVVIESSFVETTGSVVSSSSETTHRVVSTGNKTKTLQPNSLGSIIGQLKSVCTKRIYAAGFWVAIGMWKLKRALHSRKRKTVWREAPFIIRHPAIRLRLIT